MHTRTPSAWAVQVMAVPLTVCAGEQTVMAADGRGRRQGRHGSADHHRDSQPYAANPLLMAAAQYCDLRRNVEVLARGAAGLH